MRRVRVAAAGAAAGAADREIAAARAAKQAAREAPARKCESLSRCTTSRQSKRSRRRLARKRPPGPTCRRSMRCRFACSRSCTAGRTRLRSAAPTGTSAGER
eukprot:751868-Prymnesium_polylepis.2